MRYLLVNNEQQAENISRKLYELSRPLDVRDPKDTLYYIPWVIHPLTGEVALVFDREDIEELPLHSRADAVSFLSIFPAAARARIRDRLIEIRDSGEKLRPSRDLLPQAWQGRLFNHNQAVADGWFETEEEV